MKVFKNPTKSNSVLIDVSIAELKYIESYFSDLALTGKVVLPCCFYRSAKFSEFVKSIKSCKL